MAIMMHRSQQVDGSSTLVIEVAQPLYPLVNIARLTDWCPCKPAVLLMLRHARWLHAAVAIAVLLK